MKNNSKEMSEKEYIRQKKKLEKQEERLEKKISKLQDKKNDVNNRFDNATVSKVVKQEDGTKQAHKARKIILEIGATALVLVILGFGSKKVFSLIKEEKDEVRKNLNIESVDESVELEANVGEPVVTIIGGNNTDTSTIDINVEEQAEKVVDVNSEEYINEIANKAWEQILSERNTNSNFAASMDEEYINDLVKYVHHDEEGYKGTYNITNDNAYGNFFELAENDKVIGTLFEGLDSEEYMKNLNDKIANTVDNGDYKEEYEAFAAIEDAIDNVDLENVPESYAMMALLDKYLGIGQDMEAMILDNKYEILGQEVVEEYEKPRDFDKWKMLYENLKKTNPNYLFANTWDLADKEDANMEEYNKKALENMNSSESVETIYNEKATDYDAIAQGFYNQIQSYRNKYSIFAEDFTSVDDVKEFIIFVNQFKNPNMKSKINSLETFENMLKSYYNSCAIYGVEPNLSELFEGYPYAQNILAESESLAANLKNGNGNDYTIANNYYKWMGTKFYLGEVNMSLKENAPLAITVRNQYSSYRQVGNMLNARKYQKTYDLGLGEDGQLVCPDSIDDYMINQTIPEGGHVINEEATYDTFGTAYDYIKNECKGLSR